MAKRKSARFGGETLRKIMITMKFLQNKASLLLPKVLHQHTGVSAVKSLGHEHQRLTHV